MWHLPFIRALAEHRCDDAITLLTRRTTQAKLLLADEPHIYTVEYVPYVSGPLCHLRELFLTLKTLRRLQPRSLWILDKISRPAIAARILGIQDVFGFGLGSQRRWVCKPALNPDLKDIHQIDKLTAYFELQQIPVASTEPSLIINPEAINKQQMRFNDKPKPWIMLGVGARNQIRRWPNVFYRNLIERFNGAGTWFVLGGLNEFELVEREIVPHTTNPNVVNISRLNIAEAAALISCCNLFIGNDSGPMNIAAALGIATIGLFGATAPLRYSKHIRPLTSPANNRRMAAITVEEVSDLATRLGVFDKGPDRFL